MGGFRFLGTALAAGLMVCFDLRAVAHTLPISYLFVVTDKDYVHLELSFNPFELASCTEFDTNHDGKLEPEELAGAADQLTRRILEHLVLSVEGKPVSAETAGLVPDAESHHATLRAHYHVEARRAGLTLASSLQEITSSSHLSQVNFLRDGKPQLAQLDSQSRAVTFAGSATAPGILGRQKSGPAGTCVHGSLAAVALGAVSVLVGFILLRQAKRNRFRAKATGSSPLNPPPHL